MTFGNYQLEIYLQGLSGVLPSLPMDYAGWEAKAEAARGGRWVAGVRPCE